MNDQKRARELALLGLRQILIQGLKNMGGHNVRKRRALVMGQLAQVNAELRKLRAES